jgi:pilus assembly protein CpaE
MALANRKAAAAPAADSVFFAAIADETTRETVRAVARQLGWNTPVIREGGISAAAAFVRSTGAPAVLVVDIGGSEDPVVDVTALLHLCGGEVPTVAIGLVNDVKLYRRLRDAGVADYLVKPVPGEVLSAAIQDSSRVRPREPVMPKIARSIALVGARGGVGVTTLAVSVGWTMAQQQQQKVILLDLDLHFGSAALSLDIDPGRGLRELLSHPDRIDSLLIESAVTSVGDRFRLLGAEEPLEDALTHGPDGLTAVIHHLKAAADIVLVDTPRHLGPLTRHTLSMADAIVVVTDLTLPAMRDTQRLYAMLKGMHEEPKTIVVANRVGGVGGEVGIADFERGIGTKVAHSVPFDRAAAIAAAESAKPFAEVARNAKTLTALRTLSQALAGGEAPQAPSLFKRVLGR